MTFLQKPIDIIHLKLYNKGTVKKGTAKKAVRYKDMTRQQQTVYKLFVGGGIEFDVHTTNEEKKNYKFVLKEVYKFDNVVMTTFIKFKYERELEMYLRKHPETCNGRRTVTRIA